MLKKRPWWLWWLWSINGPKFCLTIAPNIYHLDPVPTAVLVHERMHIEQQKGHVIWWCWKWLTDRSFRLEVESEAMKEEFKVCKFTWEADTRRRLYAQALSSWRYLWCCSWEKAMKALS